MVDSDGVERLGVDESYQSLIRGDGKKIHRPFSNRGKGGCVTEGRHKKIYFSGESTKRGRGRVRGCPLRKNDFFVCFFFFCNSSYDH